MAAYRQDEGRYHSSYRLRDDMAGELLHDKLQFIFLELARFDKTEDELEYYYDKWMYLFKNMQRLQDRPGSFSEKEFKICNFTPEQYNNYQAAQKMIEAGFPLEKVVEISGLPEKQVREL